MKANTKKQTTEIKKIAYYICEKINGVEIFYCCTEERLPENCRIIHVS